MGRIFSGKIVRDTEFASDSLIDPALTDIARKRTAKASSKLTVTAEHLENTQIDDLTEKRN